ncbi:trimeric intracellular cation channel family protein [Fretibacter rubidus]|uniref:trimeric intracellular cation channel family protein n=1 Tax=Fretibacter rubidus TaxID=570162 RepID=UPI003529F5F9
MDITPILALDLAGVFVFALTGALAASRSEMDIFGHIVLAILPAIGGGTVRDLILDVPVFWLSMPVYIWLAVLAATIVYIAPPRVGKRLTALEWADALGLALFCVIGASKAYNLTGNITISVTMGIVTASVGGMLRDIVCNEVPLILQKEVYATAALLGGLVYCLAVKFGLGQTYALLAGGVCAFVLRGAALHWGWSLPQRRPRAD